MIRHGLLTISPQVLNEVYWVLRRKPQLGVSRDQARRQVRFFLQYATARTAPALMAPAWRLEDSAGIVYYDALLLASARDAGCSHFLSEDLNDGQLYGDVQAVNPFRHLPEDVLGPAVLTP